MTDQIKAQLIVADLERMHHDLRLLRQTGHMLYQRELRIEDEQKKLEQELMPLLNTGEDEDYEIGTLKIHYRPVGPYQSKPKFTVEYSADGDNYCRVHEHYLRKPPKRAKRK